jgi:hypothetical protein
LIRTPETITLIAEREAFSSTVSEPLSLKVLHAMKSR